jgi:hypothetical protein
MNLHIQSLGSPFPVFLSQIPLPPKSFAGNLLYQNPPRLQKLSAEEKLTAKHSAPNHGWESRRNLDYRFTPAESSYSSSHSTSTFSDLHIEDDMSQLSYPSGEATSNSVPRLPTNTPSNMALTQGNLSALQQQIAKSEDDKHNDNAALVQEQNSQQTHLKLMDAALGLGIPLFECFINELINSHNDTAPLERFVSENPEETFSPIVDRLQVLVAGDASCDLMIHEFKPAEDEK